MTCRTVKQLHTFHLHRQGSDDLPGYRNQLLLSLPHRPSTVFGYRQIRRIARTCLNSRGVHARKRFRIRFYFDVVLESSPAVLRLMDELEAELGNFTFLAGTAIR